MSAPPPPGTSRVVRTPRRGATPEGALRGIAAGRLRAALRVAIALAMPLAMPLAGCGGGGGPAAVADPSSDAEWVRATMADVYLYADRMPKAALPAGTDAAQALEALRVNPPDRFSYVEARAAYEGFFDEGRAIGVGVSLRIDAGRLRVRIVQPDSPAGRAGVRRGDRIVSVDGVGADALIAAGTVAAAFGPAEVGVVLRLGLERDGTPFELSLAKADYAVAPVLATRVIERPGGRVGYVALHTFTEPARQAWADAIATVRAAGARRLVVDLRDNGGGRLYVAAEVAGALAPAGATGQPFTVLVHNARRAADDLTIPLPAHAATGAFDRVAWLVSDASCSASESLIAGLRPYRDDPVIGTTTCGKPVGFEPRTRGDRVLSAVSFASRNRDGLADWFDGLAPTCTVADEPYLPFGDDADPRLAEALVRLETGRCSAPAAVAKSPPRAPGRLPEARGLASESGLL